MSEVDWRARARREAAAILSEVGHCGPDVSYDTLVGLLAMAWLQGVNFGSHETLATVEQTFLTWKAAL